MYFNINCNMKHDIIDLTKYLEEQYADCPPATDGEVKYTSKDIIENLKPISIQKPAIFLVGSCATNDASANDIDIVVSGEYSERQLEAIYFRLYRMFSKLYNIPYDEVDRVVHIHHTEDGISPFTSYYPLYELRLEPIDNPQKVLMTKPDTSNNLQIISKSKSSRRIIGGYASTPIIDSDGDRIPIEALEKGVKTLLSDERYASVMYEHTNAKVGNIIEGYGKYKTHIDENGLYIVCELRQDTIIANKVWEKILEGELLSFSISYEFLPQWVEVECDGVSCWKEVKNLNILEVSICSEGINELSKFDVISKSMSSKCECDNKVNKMTDEKDNVDDLNEDEKSEYTDFIKKYIKEHPGATIKEAAEAWKETKASKYPLPDKPIEEPYPDKYPLPEKPTGKYPIPKSANADEEVTEDLSQWANFVAKSIDALSEEFNKFKEGITSKLTENKSQENEEEANDTTEEKSESEGDTNTEISDLLNDMKSTLNSIMDALETLKSEPEPEPEENDNDKEDVQTDEKSESTEDVPEPVTVQKSADEEEQIEESVIIHERGELYFDE